MGKIHFFTGKGGVGKSTVALAKALQMADSGCNTLLVEYSQLNTMGRHLNLPVSFKPLKFKENLHIASWNGEDCLKEYVKHSVKIRFIFEFFYRSKAINALIKAAPALKEISFLGYLTSHFRNAKPRLNFDHIIVDAPSTGHFLSCLQVPKSLLEITSVGPMGQHCRGIVEVLKDPQKTRVYTVFTPEDLVLKEQSELLAKLQSEFEITPAVIMNRSLTKADIKVPQDIRFADHAGEQYLEYLNHTLKIEQDLIFLQEKFIHAFLPESFKDNFVEISKDLVPYLEPLNFGEAK